MNTINPSQEATLQLAGVPQTLLMPLLGRAKFSKIPYSPVRDQLAIQLVDSLNYNFADLEKRLGSVALYFMARAYHFDQAVNKYLLQHPAGKIVNLGAGLETAFYRLDNQQLTWIDLDLPEVIALREKLLPPSNRVFTIAKSVLDFSWIDDLKKQGSEFFFFAGRLLPYFTEEEVKALLKAMANRLPKSEFVFDTISSKGMYYANKMLAQSNMADAVMRWSLDDPAELEKWSLPFHLTNQIKYFDGIKSMKGFPLSLRIRMLIGDLRSKPPIIHLKFD